MLNKNDINLALHRIEQANECLQSAEIAIETSLKTSINRSYYCIFHAMRAVLALDKFDSRKHSGIISAFRQRYIKTGEFDPSFSDVIGAAFEVRNESDYEDFYIVSESEAQQQLIDARTFLAATVMYIDKVVDLHD